MAIDIAKHLLLPAAVASVVSVPIAVNHDEAYLEHQRTTVSSIGEYQREHVLGWIAAGGLLGSSITAGALRHPRACAFLGAATIGTLTGTLAGHVGWDRFLAREQGAGAAPR